MPPFQIKHRCSEAVLADYAGPERCELLTPPDPARFTTPGPAERFLIRLSAGLLLVFVGLMMWQAITASCGL